MRRWDACGWRLIGVYIYHAFISIMIATAKPIWEWTSACNRLHPFLNLGQVHLFYIFGIHILSGNVLFGSFFPNDLVFNLFLVLINDAIHRSRSQLSQFLMHLLYFLLKFHLFLIAFLLLPFQRFLNFHGMLINLLVIYGLVHVADER